MLFHSWNGRQGKTEIKEQPGLGWGTEPYRCCFSLDGGGSLKTTDHCLLECRETASTSQHRKVGAAVGALPLAPHSRCRQPRFEPWSAEMQPTFTGAVK